MKHFLWVEKYRPTKIEDCILPDSIKKTFKEFLLKGEVPNLLLCGTAGTGKTDLYGFSLFLIHKNKWNMRA